MKKIKLYIGAVCAMFALTLAQTFFASIPYQSDTPKVQKSANPMLDAEALRVIKMMPKWKPGIMNGKPCRTMFAIPVNFVI